MADPMDEVRFWAQVIEDSRRTVLCSPELESRVKMRLEALGVAGMYDVVASRMVPDDAIFVVDMQAMEAATAQAIQRIRTL